MKCKDHSLTKDFIDLTQGFGLLPLINKPTRITLDSATIIDNIFSNATVKSECGLIIDDTISDHLPVFSIIKLEGIINDKDKAYYKMVRNDYPENIENLRKELGDIDWSDILNSNNVDNAYSTFVNKIKLAYDKWCPLRMICDLIEDGVAFREGLRCPGPALLCCTWSAPLPAVRRREAGGMFFHRLSQVPFLNFAQPEKNKVAISKSKFN